MYSSNHLFICAYTYAHAREITTLWLHTFTAGSQDMESWPSERTEGPLEQTSVSGTQQTLNNRGAGGGGGSPP